MPNSNRAELNPMQPGKYAEYYAKMEFASYGFEVYSSEVDGHGVDFVVKVPGTYSFYEVQAKSIRNYGYVLFLNLKCLFLQRIDLYAIYISLKVRCPIFL